MKDTTKVWDKGLEEALENLVSIFRKSIICDAEAFANFSKSDKVTAQGLEVALYKSVMTLNESNKATIIQKLGPKEAMDMIRRFEERAMLDISMTIMEDAEVNWDNLPPNLQEILTEIKKRINQKGKNEKKEP